MTIYLNAPGGSTTGYHRPQFAKNPNQGSTVLTTKREALAFLWKTRKKTPRWQRPGIGQLSLKESLVVAIRVLFGK